MYTVIQLKWYVHIDFAQVSPSTTNIEEIFILLFLLKIIKKTASVMMYVTNPNLKIFDLPINKGLLDCNTLDH